MKRLLTAIAAAALLCLSPVTSQADSTDAKPGRTMLVGGWIGGAAYGPEREAGARINVGTFGAVELFRLTETSSLFAAYQYYHVGGGETEISADGFKALFTNQLIGLPGHVILGGGFLDDVKATLTPTEEDESTMTESNGLEFDIGLAWPIGDQVDLVVMAMFIDRGDLGTAINFNVAAGIRNPLSILTGAVGL